MQVEYVYHGQELELYSLWIRKPNIEHFRVTAASTALILRAAACASCGDADAIRLDATATILTPLFRTRATLFSRSGPVGLGEPP
jgi:hypothetical protein